MHIGIGEATIGAVTAPDIVGIILDWLKVVARLQFGCDPLISDSLSIRAYIEMTIVRLVSSAVCVIGLAALLAACGNNKTYGTIEPGLETERSRANLELPPDLVGTASDSLQATQAEQDGLNEEVLPEPEGLNVERNDKEGWLEVDAPVEQVWRRLISHWGSLGVDLAVSDPQAGIMETDWVRPGESDEEEGNLGETLVSQFLGRLVDERTSLDKYTMQLERVGDNRSRIHVSHKGIKKIQTSEAGVARNAQWEWVETEEESAKVRRAMSSILYGLDADQS